ncbi:MAG TPA: PAS domain-containing protein, partial [Opitutaceae bacterium]|nr:PAS domain-containing protein [Opitutaceae bacterium]
MVLFNLLLLALLVGAYVVIRRQRQALADAELRRVRDLDAQREAFGAAQRAERTRAEAMLDAMVEGLVVIDATGHIVVANHAAEEMFAFSRMMAGGTLLEAIRNHEVAALARRAVGETAPLEHEIRVERPTPCVLQVSAVSLHDPTGTRSGAVLVFHDITRLRQLEAVRQDFVANVSHELRTP